MLASTGWDGRLRLWEVATGTEIISAAGGPEEIEFAPDGRQLAVFSHSHKRVAWFELALNEAKVNLIATDSRPRPQSGDALSFSLNGDWVATSMDDAITFWRPATGERLARVEQLPFGSLAHREESESLFGLAAHGFYRLPVVGTGHHPVVGRAERVVPQVPDGLRYVCAPEFVTGFTTDRGPGRAGATPDGRLFAVAYRSRCYVLDTKTAALASVTGQQNSMKYVAISPDGRWIATGGWHNSNVKIWNLRSGALEKELATDISPNVAFSPEGRWLVTGTGSEYRFWRTTDWSPAHRIPRPGDDDLPGPMAFSNDGKLLALADTRGVVHLVAPETGATLAQIEPAPSGELICLAFNPDASLLGLTLAGAPPQVWNLRHIRQQLATMQLDW
jgi:WD40 repeat protein